MFMGRFAGDVGECAMWHLCPDGLCGDSVGHVGGGGANMKGRSLVCVRTHLLIPKHVGSGSDEGGDA